MEGENTGFKTRNLGFISCFGADLLDDLCASVHLAGPQLYHLSNRDKDACLASLGETG